MLPDGGYVLFYDNVEYGLGYVALLKWGNAQVNYWSIR